MRAALLCFGGVFALAACSDPVIDMRLAMPTDPAAGAAFDMSCVTSVEVLAHGTRWPSDATDSKRSCIAIAGPTDLAAVQRALAGKFELPLPDDGLGSIELNGRTGTCDPPPAGQSPGDLLFYAGNEYLGADTVTLQVKANQSCAQAPVTVRIYDLMKLVASHVNSAADCTAAQLEEDPSLDPGVGFGTFAPTLHGLGWNQGVGGGTYASGGVTAQAMDTVGPDACFGVNAGNQYFYSLACVNQTTTPVCAAAGELEVPVMDGQVSFSAIDATKVTKWGGLVIGSVWTANGTSKAPFAGATVKVDKMHGEVVYFAPNGDGSALLAVDGATSTSASGLFGVYADSIVEVTITANGTQRKVRMGAKTDTAIYPPAIALVQVN